MVEIAWPHLRVAQVHVPFCQAWAAEFLRLLWREVHPGRPEQTGASAAVSWLEALQRNILNSAQLFALP